MLNLVNIKKNYYMRDQEPVRALRGISLNFRRNEFVAVLGPSGCGKTTLLNIIGGLDRYTDGDLIIKNTSTKNFKDRDWDTYRNHSIGFVFQAYNLIGHQNVLRNVELALTIGGIDKKERKERAMKALERVGLKGMEKKRPNQLSGGQMQRVAIARALVNNPEILLADEPTGALDSETSIQIMDLLKEVANDRLVIMVTHNPDLAEKYATRIVNMFDGIITGDTNPFDGIEKDKRYRCPKCGTIFNGRLDKCPTCHATMKYLDKKPAKDEGKNKKSSMSFLTATSLSIANLFSKSKRTLLVAIAGSIGIFGVSTVLAASTGVRHYIDSMQDDMLSSYPLTIAEETVDYTSLMAGLYSDPDTKIPEFDATTSVGLNSMIDYLMDRYSDITQVKTNTINDDLVQFINEIPSEYVSATSFSYGIDPTNNIFTYWEPNEGEQPIWISLNGITQRYIAELNTVDGFSRYASYVDLFTDFMKLMPGEEEYILSQYDLLGDSHFPDPDNPNEIMLVVEGDTTLTDLVFAQMGYYHEQELINIAQKAIEKYDPNNTLTEEQLNDKYKYSPSFTFEQLLNKKLRYFPHDTIYHYDEIDLGSHDEYSIVLQSATNDEFYIFQQDSTFDNYTKGTAMEGMPIFKVTYLKTSPFETQSFYAFNTTYGQEGGSNEPAYGTFLCAKSDSISELTGVLDSSGSMTDEQKQALIYTLMLEGKLLMITVPEAGSASIRTGIMTPPQQMEANVTKEQKDDAIKGFQYPAVAEASWGEGTEITIAGILKPKKGVSFGCLSRGVYYTKAFQEKYMNDSKNSEIINDNTHGFLKHINDESKQETLYDSFVTFDYPDYRHNGALTSGHASCLNGDLSSSFASLFSSITGHNYFEDNQVHFRSLCGLKLVENTGENGEISYAPTKLPEEISIYPVNFAYKDKVTEYLDQWNAKQDIVLNDGKVLHFEGEDARDELTYTDTISLIITVIDTMITIVTTALIIFTSLSLIVSSFMIAVITYISVMERVKEIGVIRSLGGRKKDVSRLFIAENLVTGVLSGIIGLGITAVVCVIINLIVSPFGIPSIALLTLPIAGIMLALSVFLSVMAGLIPSMHASRQDPVIALRSE